MTTKNSWCKARSRGGPDRFPAKYKKLSHVATGECQVRVINARNLVSVKGAKKMVLNLSLAGGRAKTLDLIEFAGDESSRAASFLAAVGVRLKGSDDIDPALFVGRRARALVEVFHSYGGVYNKIAKWLPRKSAAGKGQRPVHHPTK